MKRQRKLVVNIMGVKQPVTAGHRYYSKESPQFLNVRVETDSKDRCRMTFWTDTEELCEELTFEKMLYGDIDLLDGEDVVIDMEN